MKKYCCLFFIFFNICTAIAQNVVKGQVLGDKGVPLGSVFVAYGKIGTTILSGFSRSDHNGNFMLVINEKSDSILLYFSLLGYEKKTISLKNETQTSNIKLKQKVEALKDIIVTAMPIYRRNDTLNYDVSTFTSKQDRVIGDIIRKLPGIEIDGGKILYQGKPIQKYYINGLDLLEGKYGLANNNLPADAVLKVQVIENSQPIKILDSLIFSDKASLNIKLKKLTTTGSAKAGVGLSPFLRDIGITPMIFDKSLQTINNFQSNNIGDNSRDQIQNFDTPDMLDIGSIMTSEFLIPINLSIRDVSSPPFQEKKWLDNNINLFNSNILKKLENDMELKGSITYLNNKISRYGKNEILLFTPSQNIAFLEEIDNKYNSNYLDGNFMILKNEKSIYLKNIFSTSFEQTSDVGNILRNQASSIYQKKDLETTNVSNRFSMAKLFGKQLVTFGSLINYSQAPQSLTIMPNPFSILNNSVSNSIQQQVRYQNLEVNNYVSFIKGYKRLSLLPKLGISYQKQILNSHIEPAQEPNSTIVSNANNLMLRILQAYLDTKIQYNKERLKIDLNAPIYLRNFAINNKNEEVLINKNRIIAEPGLSLIYQLNSNFKIITAGNYKKYFSDIGMLYNALIINSYQEIRKYNGTINESNNYNTNLSVEYANPASSIFGDFSYINTAQHKDYIIKNQIDTNGFNTVDILNLPNWTVSNSLNVSASKYLLKIKTLVKIRAFANYTSSYYLFEDILQQLRTRGYSVSINLDNAFLDNFSFNYTSKISVFKNLLFGQTLSSNIFINQHTMEINCFPLKNQIFTLNGEYFASNQKQNRNQLLIDVKYRFSITKPKLDFEISAINLLNTTSYNQLYTAEYIITQSSFNLRKRQFMFTTRFKF